jgi:L-iditol 2-dehydrogenase
VRAARLHGIHDVCIDEVPTPEPGAGEVLLRVAAVAVCPSDWRLYEDGHAGGVVPDHPMIQGHEFAGEVVRLGLGVENPVVGTRVAVEPSWHCGKCDSCLKGLTNLCRNQVFPSFPPHDGALAEYIAVPAYATCALPESVPYVEGALMEPLTVALHALRLAGAAAGDRTVVLGAGVVGLCLVMCAKAAGVGETAVVEPVGGRLARAQALDAEPAAASTTEFLARGWEADIVFDCAGEPAAVEEAMGLARPAGKVVIVGIPHPERVSFEADVPRRRELTVVFARRSRDELPDAVALAAEGGVDLSLIPVREFRLEQTKEALDLTATKRPDVLRAIVIP